MMISSRKSQNNGDMSRSGGEEKSNEEPNRSIPFEWDRRTDVNEIVEVALRDRRYLAGCFSIEFSHRHIWSPPVPARISIQIEDLTTGNYDHGTYCKTTKAMPSNDSIRGWWGLQENTLNHRLVC